MRERMGLSTIYGQVIDKKSGKEIVGATVTSYLVTENSQTQSTDTSKFGSYLIDIESNMKIRLLYQSEGYYPKIIGNILCPNHHFLRVDTSLQRITSLTNEFSYESNIYSKTQLTTLETIIINSPKRLEYSRRLRTWKIIR